MFQKRSTGPDLLLVVNFDTCYGIFHFSDSIVLQSVLSVCYREAGLKVHNISLISCQCAKNSPWAYARVAPW